MIGLAFMVFHIAVQNAVAAISAPEDRAVNYSWLALGFSISGFLGPTTAGLAIDIVGHRADVRLPRRVRARARARHRVREARASRARTPGRRRAGA